MRKLIVVAIALLLMIVGVAVAYASIPGPDGVIHGCYKTSNPAQGAVIAIDSGASCPSGYTALNWQVGQGKAVYEPYMVRSFFTVPNDGAMHAFNVVCNPQTGLDLLMGLTAVITDQGPTRPNGLNSSLSQNTAGYAGSGYVYAQGNDPSGPASALEVDLSCAKVAP